MVLRESIELRIAQGITLNLLGYFLCRGVSCIPVVLLSVKPQSDGGAKDIIPHHSPHLASAASASSRLSLIRNTVCRVRSVALAISDAPLPMASMSQTVEKVARS